MTQQNVRHVPVLFQEVMDFLSVRPGGTYVDCTAGMGGHSEGIARQLGPMGHLIAFDRDPEALELAKARLDRVCEELGNQAPEVTLIGEAFSSLPRHVKPASVDGLLADFGASSLHFDEARRGFSFQADGPLDMRMDTRSGPTAAQVVNETGERELANLIYELSEERRSRTVARAIVRGRPITTTGQLVRIVASVVPPIKGSHIHPATKTFQALRIAVNNELDEIKALLEAAPNLLKPSARLVVISFHSLEDRIAKDSIREGAKNGIWNILTKKPVVAGEEETDKNPRARSAKLRAAEKLGNREQGTGNRRQKAWQSEFGEFNYSLFSGTTRESKMAACTTTMFESGRGWNAQIAEHNQELMAQQPARRRRVRTPEFHFVRNLDNSRLVKAPDPVRMREMRVFSAAVAVLFSLIMIYGLQHFYAIESSYHVESEKLAVEQLREENRQLRLTQAELTQPARIDQMARQLGLAAPQPGQVVQASAHSDSSTPALAQLTPPTPPAR